MSTLRMETGAFKRFKGESSGTSTLSKEQGGGTLFIFVLPTRDISRKLKSELQNLNARAAGLKTIFQFYQYINRTTILELSQGSK